MQRGDLYWPAMPEPGHHDLFSEPAPTQEYLQDWLVRTCELIDRYRPRLLYFDWWIQHSAFKPYLKKLAAYYYNRAREWGVEVAIDYKHDAFSFGTAVPDVERGQFADVKPYFWQTDTAVALTPGATPSTTTSGPIRTSCRTWWISSARTAACCSTWGRGRTARSARRTGRCCWASAAGCA